MDAAARHLSANSTAGGDAACGCAALLAASESQFLGARRTAQELKYAAGTNENGQSKYNYSRLGAVVLHIVWDGAGNWRVHEKCVRRFLGVSNSWMAAWHQRAMELSKEPTRAMLKAEILADVRRDDLIGRVVRPDGCLLSLRRFFAAAANSDSLTVTSAAAAHGLKGKASNRTRTKARELFRSWVEAHRCLTGRAPDRNGRAHGAAWYLHSRFEVLRPQGTRDERPSVAVAFNDALAASETPPINTQVIGRWMRELFGSHTITDGVRVPSLQHTTICPHKTDACGTCETLRGDLRHCEQSRKRHVAMADQSTQARRDAVAGLTQAVDEIKAALAEHNREAAAAIGHHKTCIASAASRYTDREAAWRELLGADRTDRDGLSSACDAFVSSWGDFWFDISSNYQEDKALPSWNRSPQPGPTYFLSGETHYVHIMCMESCGVTTGASRFSRNLVYTRSECVGGAKCSDDTLSTVSDALLGGSTIGLPSPSLYRTGFAVPE